MGLAKYYEDDYRIYCDRLYSNGLAEIGKYKLLLEEHRCPYCRELFTDRDKMFSHIAIWFSINIFVGWLRSIHVLIKLSANSVVTSIQPLECSGFVPRCILSPSLPGTPLKIGIIRLNFGDQVTSIS